MIGDIQMQNLTTALNDAYKLVEYCNGGPVDHAGADAAAIVAKQNAGTFVQRECYSGFYAPHGTDGLLPGARRPPRARRQHEAAAQAYYAACRATGLRDWPLKPVVERRVSRHAAGGHGTLGIITSTCATCHANELP